jgi:arylsulfatase A-like enzyme
VGFENNEGDFAWAPQCESLFSQAHAAGYTTYLVGWYHPYRLMFGPDLDYCWSAPSSAQTVNSDTVFERIIEHLHIGLGKSVLAIPKPPALQWRAQRLFERSESEHVVETTKDIHNLAVTIIRHQTGPSLAVFHYPVPHWPFVYNRDGLNPDASIENPLYFGAGGNDGPGRPAVSGSGNRSRSAAGYVERYIDNLRYTDTLIGELIDAMMSAGRFNGATIILTSDHTWRDDPALGDHPTMAELTHVPLIVKYPYQSKASDVDEPFPLSDLRPVMRALRTRVHVSSRRHTPVSVINP